LIYNRFGDRIKLLILSFQKMFESSGEKYSLRENYPPSEGSEGGDFGDGNSLSPEPDGQSEFQKYVAEEAEVEKRLKNPRGTYFRNREKFKQTFSKYGDRIEDAVADLIWEGHSLDWVNMFRETVYDPDDPSAGPDDNAGSDLNYLYSKDNLNGNGSAEQYDHLPDEEKISLMKDIIRELFGHILDYRHKLSNSDQTLASSFRTRNYYKSDYSAENAKRQLNNFPDHSTARNTEDYDTERAEIGTYEFVIKQAITELGKIDSSQELVDFLLNFWDESKDPYFGPVIATAISRNNAEVGVARILDDLKNAEDEDQNRLLSLLYRLELGQVGISAEGVNYLGRRFDVGLYDGFVSRLTADGKVGVFDELKRLIGLFQLESEDFTAQNEGAIKKNLETITLEMLFTPRPDETEADREQKLKLLEDFKTKYFETYIEQFGRAEEQSGFRFNNLSLPEQGFVLLHLSKYDKESPEHQKFFKFIAKFGEDGFRAFRSLEFDAESGEKILELGSTIPTHELKERFSKYAEVYQTAEKVAEWVKNVLRVDMENPTAKDLLEVNIIREQILREAQAALVYPVAEHNQPDAFDNYGQPIVDQALSSAEWLHYMNHELKMVVDMEPTIENFAQAQFILSRYLMDTAETGDRLSVSEQVISDGLTRLYNNKEFSLRDYEGKTSDTTQSLVALLKGIGEMPSQETTGDPSELLIYDIGAGDGRIAIPLALSGCRVVGIDISQRMIDDSKTRPGEIIDAIRSKRPDHLVDSTQNAFSACGLEITDDKLDTLPDQIDIHQGNFSHFGPDEFIQNFGERQPDVVVIMWHTLGFARGVEGMEVVLKNAYRILRPGGRIFIEMPDRNFGGYARAIREFHDANPTEPLGALRDAPSTSSESPTEQDEDRATWRYFPKNSEIIETLKGVGFDPHIAFPDSYFVLAGGDSDRRPLIKENLFVAEKPFDKGRQEKMIRYMQSLSYNRTDHNKNEIEKIRDEIDRAA